MHAAAYAYVASVASRCPDGLVVEIGGRNINGSVRLLFGMSYRSVDAMPGRGVDVVASGADYTPEMPASCVVCCEVLEHTAEAEAICRNAYRMLRHGGSFIVTAAGEGRAPHSAVDGGEIRGEEYYANVTPEKLRAWLSDFQEVVVTANPATCDIYAIATKHKPKVKG